MEEPDNPTYRNIAKEIIRYSSRNRIEACLLSQIIAMIEMDEISPRLFDMIQQRSIEIMERASKILEKERGN